MATIRIASWNVLAAPWADPSFYPEGMDASLLDRTRRAPLVAETLRGLDADVVCLQEVTPLDLTRVVEDLGHAYDHHHVGNGRDLWSGWTTAAVPWEPNGTAVLWRHGVLVADHRGSLPIHDDGNVATWVALTHRYGARLRVMSVHLDADEPALRRAELPVALAAWVADPDHVDVVAGDCNEDTGAGDLAATVAEHGFVDALAAVGVGEPTHPYARPEDPWAVLARLDHVLVRGARPAAGAVHDFGTWAGEVPAERMAQLLRTTGSDHLPVTVDVELGA